MRSSDLERARRAPARAATPSKGRHGSCCTSAEDRVELGELFAQDPADLLAEREDGVVGDLVTDAVALLGALTTPP